MKTVQELQQLVYTFHSDPSHAWLEVTQEALKTLGIENDVSCWSYVYEDKAYLEEDCDAGLFIKTLFHGSPEARAKLQINEEIYNDNCFIRALSSYC